MRLQVMSDLHLEFYPDYGAQLISELDASGVDVLVLAGDVFNFSPKYQLAVQRAVEALCKKYSTVLYVPGNHEYWGTDPESGQAFARSLNNEAFQTLEAFEPVNVVKHGVKHRFLGDTMWFPFNANNWKFERNMPDFRRIKGLAEWVYKRNDMFRDYIYSYCGEGDVVITHHSPSYKSVPDQFQGSSINRFFVSSMEKAIEKTKPALWIHGHTHTQFDYKLGGTRVVCNPRGYPGEESQFNWDARMIIELP